jgi:hypothetical protein
MSSPPPSGEGPEFPGPFDSVPAQKLPHLRPRRFAIPYFEAGLVLAGLLVLANAFVAKPEASGRLTFFITVVAIAVLVGVAIYGITRFLLDGDTRSTSAPSPAQELRTPEVAVLIQTTTDGNSLPTTNVSPDGTSQGTVTVTLDPAALAGTAAPKDVAEHEGVHTDGGVSRGNGSSSPSSEYEKQIQAWLHHTRNRFEKEIRDLSRRGRFNLALGVVIGAVGLGVLLWSVLDFEGQIQAVEEVRSTVESLKSGRRLPFRVWQNSAILQTMRVSLSLFLGAFAFFFLRLYRSSLDLIKYYQNEETNVEGWFAALMVALQMRDPAITSVVVSQLSRTERNFVLKQGETTVELELARQDGEKIREVLRLLGSSSLAQRVRNIGTTSGAQG